MEQITIEKLQGSSSKWWVYLILGLALMVAGIWLFLDPVDQLALADRILSVLVVVIGAGQMVAAAWRRDTEKRWWWQMIIGGLELILGIVALVNPGLSGALLGAFIAFWMILRGAFLITFALRFRQLEEQSWLWLLVGGSLTILMAIFVYFNPSESLSIYFWIALNMVVTGIFHALLSFDLRVLKRKLA